MFTIPMTLVVVTVFAIYLSAVQSILAATTLTVLSTALVTALSTALVSLVHLYTVVAVGAGVVLALAALAGWYVRTDPGAVYAASDRHAIARFHLRHRGR